jgi:hypothetical protein
MQISDSDTNEKPNINAKCNRASKRDMSMRESLIANSILANIAPIYLAFVCATYTFGLGAYAAEEVLPRGDNPLSNDSRDAVVLELAQFPLQSSVVDIIDIYPHSPRYVERVYAGGTVEFNGLDAVRTIRTDHHRLEKARMDELVEKLRSLKLDAQSTEERYPFSVFARLTVSVDGRSHELEFGPKNVARYIEIRELLERYLHTMTYRCPLSQAQREAAVEGTCDQLFELPRYLPVQEK